MFVFLRYLFCNFSEDGSLLCLSHLSSIMSAKASFGFGFGTQGAAATTPISFGFGVPSGTAAPASAPKKTCVIDLKCLTGLKSSAIEALLTRFGSEAAVLASFVQSLKTIPDDMFDDKSVHVAMASEINKILKDVYAQARKTKEMKKCTDLEAIKAFTSEICSQPAATAASSNPKEATDDDSSTRIREPRLLSAPQHDTGAFFGMPHFWSAEVEERAPLFNLDAGFLEKNRSELPQRIKRWLGGTSFYQTPVSYVAMDDEDEYYARVIIKDAHRTFFHPDHRKKFAMFLYAMFYEFREYGQAMSYLAGLCLLVLTEAETAAVLRKVRKEYIPGHWAAEAVGFATSAWVVEFFMKKLFPEVAAHFNKINFWPDTYLQKILSGLCVHVLEFRFLFDFLDLFMQSGFEFLVRFCLGIIEVFQDKLLSKPAAKINELYEIMRLDKREVDPAIIPKIFAAASAIKLGSDAHSMDLIRSQVYDEKLAKRMQRASKVETFEPCQLCETGRPKWFTDDHGAVCDACKAKLLTSSPALAFEAW
jgi:hypothetical protein